jgi:DNA adenine methylase
VVLSGYHSALYDELYADWPRVERATLADGARPRVEVLWISPRTLEVLTGEQGRLFGEM